MTKIDDMFSENFPSEIKTTAADLELRIGIDQNTTKRIVKRIKSAKKRGVKPNYMQAVINICINLWFKFINFFYITIYYYFFPLICIVLQYVAFYYLEVAKAEEFIHK